MGVKLRVLMPSTSLSLKLGAIFSRKTFVGLAEFHRRTKLDKELNATFLTMIPKVPTPVDLEGLPAY